MNVTTQEPLVARPWAQILYLGLASLILIGILTEGLLIGPSLFAGTHWGRAIHGNLGAVLFILTVLLPVAARLARLPGRAILLSTMLFVLSLVEVTSAALARTTPFLAAVHPANALLMAGLTVVLLTQAWPLMRERKGAIRRGRLNAPGLRE